MTKTVPTPSTLEERERKLERTGKPKEITVRRNMLPILQHLEKNIGLLERTDSYTRDSDPLVQQAVMFAIPKVGKVNEYGQTLLRLIVDARLANAQTSDVAALNYSLFKLFFNVSQMFLMLLINKEAGLASMLMYAITTIKFHFHNIFGTYSVSNVHTRCFGTLPYLWGGIYLR